MSKLSVLSLEQIEILKRFALLEARIEEVRDALSGVFDFDFGGPFRMVVTKFRVPQPGVIITRDHIHNADDQRQFGKISKQDLVLWATMLLMNDAFELDPNDQEFVAEWLNGVSFNGYPGAASSSGKPEAAANHD